VVGFDHLITEDVDPLLLATFSAGAIAEVP
jgi:hypothetical protein